MASRSAARAQGGIMAEPRDGRLTYTASRPQPEAPNVGGIAVEPRWVREPRLILTPVKSSREWDRVRRIAYL
jgi:hypothetical protein